MPSLLDIPGLGGYLQAQQIGTQQQGAQLQQMGAIQGILAKQRALQQDQALRGALSQLPPDATEEDIVKAVMPHVGGKELLTTMTASKDRQAALEVQKQTRKDALEARLYQIDQMAADRALSREQQALLAKQADATRRELAQMGFALRRDIADSNRANMNKPPAGYRFKGDGSLEAIPGGPADQKLNQAGTGRETVNSLIATLRDQYSQLQEGGGITDPKAGPIDNLKAGISASGPGQFVGRMIGTQNQSARNQIAQQRPLLLNAIKQATGMTAKQMDSNAELKLYLSAATDPTLDIRANIAALDKLDELYGLGGKTAPGPQGSQPNVIDFNQLPKRR